MTQKENTNENLDEVISKVDLSEKTELGEVGKQFNENTPNSSNISQHQSILIWKTKSTLKGLGYQDLDFTDDFIALQKSVGGWNTEKKVEAITGIQKQRGGGFMERLFAPKNPQ